MTRGYLTFAQNSGVVNYLELAYVQALSIKVSNNINNYAVVVDEATLSLVTDKHRQVFDYIIPVPLGDDAKHNRWKMQNEWKALLASPYDETIKLECDMIIPANIDHWWDIMSKNDICFSTNVAAYNEKLATTRVYRKVFDDNALLDVYAGFYYFKKSKAATEFFDYAEAIFKNWEYIKTSVLKQAEHEPASTDLVFALAARFVGKEQCYAPGNIPMFTHMKGAIQGWPAEAMWTEYVYHQFDQGKLTVGFHRQRLPFHYHYKNFPTQDIINHYEQLYFK